MRILLRCPADGCVNVASRAILDLGSVATILTANVGTDRNFLSRTSKVPRPPAPRTSATRHMNQLCRCVSRADLGGLLDIGVESPANRATGLCFSPIGRSSPDHPSGTNPTRSEIAGPFSARRRPCRPPLLALEVPQNRVNHVVLRDDRDHLHLVEVSLEEAVTRRGARIPGPIAGGSRWCHGDGRALPQRRRALPAWTVLDRQSRRSPADATLGSWTERKFSACYVPSRRFVSSTC